MTVKQELYIPLHFFDSAKAENHFESVSERIAKLFLRQVLGIENIRRGDDKLHEPDYVAEEVGYEVTFAIESSLFPQLKGVKPLDRSRRNVEDAMINDIQEACRRKSVKNYSCKRSLVIISLGSSIIWHTELFFNDTDPFAQMAWRMATRNRNAFFADLTTNYLDSSVFENIYIIQPTHDGGLAFFDIKKFSQKEDGYVLYVKPEDPEKFPIYRITSVVDDDKGYSFETTIVNYTE